MVTSEIKTWGKMLTGLPSITFKIIVIPTIFISMDQSGLLWSVCLIISVGLISRMMFFILIVNHSECVSSLLQVCYRPEGSPPCEGGHSEPASRSEAHTFLIIMVWVRTQCEVEILAIHTIEMIPKSMILMILSPKMARPQSP